jgi:hypothetical protein
MTYEEAMRWMRAHGGDIEELSADGDPKARPVSYRFTELLMDPNSVWAQARLVEAVSRYCAARPEMAVPPLEPPRGSLAQQVLDDITREEDARGFAQGGLGDPPPEGPPR